MLYVYAEQRRPTRHTTAQVNMKLQLTVIALLLAIGLLAAVNARPHRRPVSAVPPFYVFFHWAHSMGP